MGRNTLNKYISRLMAVLLAMLLLVTALPPVYAEGESGTCGENLSWSFSAGTLTITGSGAMEEYHEMQLVPWYSLRHEILRISLPDGLTSIGMLAFYQCEKLTVVKIPSSVTRIGEYAFAECTSLELLNLGSNVQFIGECAFSECVNLKSLHLPGSVRTIGPKVFYRCEALTTVTVPAGVTSIGMSAFSYCKNLVSATIHASVSVVPEYLFYGCERLTAVDLPEEVGEISDYAFRGCDSLSSVYYDGESMTAKDIQNIINTDVPGFNITGFVTGGTPSDRVVSGSTIDNGDGTITQENITVTENENISVSTKVETTRPEGGGSGTTNAEISITIRTEAGWDEAKDAAEDALKDYNDNVAANGTTSQTVGINLYVQGTNHVDQSFVESMAGRDVQMNVVTEEGSAWRMEGEQIDPIEPSGKYNLSCTLSAGSQALSAELETQTSFMVRFHATAEVNAEVLIRVGEKWALQNATLFERGNRDSLIKHQTVVVDKQGYAHFYLAAVSNETDYYIAMNLPVAQEEVLIPNELRQEYGNMENYVPIQYVITGRKSSWGMSANQVTWIMIGVLAFCAVCVGVVMYILNQRKLMKGYVPDISEEDWEEE